MLIMITTCQMEDNISLKHMLYKTFLMLTNQNIMGQISENHQTFKHN